MYVVKIGGSLFREGRGIVRYLRDHAEEIEEQIVLVPGGGIFADLVRSVEIDDEAAHWMAILGMEQYGYYLSSGIIPAFDDFSEERIYMLLPYRLMKERDPLPHSWDVTSDSIGAWIARELSAEYIRATNVDGILAGGRLVNEIRASELPEGATDRFLPKFLEENGMRCAVVNGRYPERIIQAMRGIITGTLITP
ncbi:MAG: hypothetical protein H5T47_07040 [Archaeoglobi archaeon]|nr:hypothetical protein [Candidatus Mnemosynella bozhongmuii]